MRAAFTLILAGLIAGPLSAEGNLGAEEAAALLLSPDQTKRARALDWIKRLDSPQVLKAVLSTVGKWGHDREAWIVALEKERQNASGLKLKRIQEMLGHLKPDAHAIVSVDVCCAVVPTELAKQILGTTPDLRAPVTVWPDGNRMLLCLGWIEKDTASRIYFSRRMPVGDRTTLTVSGLKKVTYVRDVEVTPQGVADPVIDTVMSGAEVRVRPVFTRDLRFVTLETKVDVSDLERPLAVVEKKLPGFAQRARIQVPTVVSTTVKSVITLPIGGHCVVGMPAGAGVAGPGAKDRTVLVFLRASQGAAIALPAEKHGEPR